MLVEAIRLTWASAFQPAPGDFCQMHDEKSLMIRLRSKDKDYLQQLARERKESMTKVIEDLLEEHRRRSFFEGLAAEYAVLKQDHQAWQEELSEQALLDTAASDGLENE